MDAVPHDPKATAFSACTNCEACHRVCPESAITFSYGRPSSVEAVFPGGLSRRGFLGGLGVGVCVTVLTRLHPGVIKGASRLLRPPGAIPESEFLGTCVRCGLCIRACVTHTLQASGAERGLLHWGTPIHVMRFAGCEQQCALCGEVCPTGAIRKLTLVERQHAKVGTAVLSQERCVAWKQDQLCLLCDEACPYNAIVFHTIQGHKRPLVDEARCNGCGICECVCPVQGEAAIIVHQDGEVRLAHGSYREALREREILFRPKSDILG